MGRELTGALAIGPDIAPVLVEGGSSKQVVTEQREELCQALLPHPDQMARPVIAYGQFDKISTAWKLSLPGLTTDLTSPVFKEVVAMHLLLPSIVCKEVVGKRFGDEIKCAQLPGDSWRFRRLISSCIVGAKAQCLISRVGVVSPEARVAAQGREARELGEELRAQWMASVRRPGWARRGTLSNYDLVLGDDK